MEERELSVIIWLKNLKIRKNVIKLVIKNKRLFIYLMVILDYLLVEVSAIVVSLHEY